jgi:oligopeptide/dipeptide ABC transporter ATP-binding protein
MSTILQVENLKKYFSAPKGYLHAVDDVSFSIEEGTTLGIVGESGCGKSTLGRTIIHLLDSTGGKIKFMGEDVTRVSKHKLRELRENMQIIFQDPLSSLSPRMTVFQVISDPFIIQGKKSKKEIEVETRKLMDTVGLAQEFAYSYPHELDGGRCQRVGIARALALKPKFIVCDEPVSALDVSIQAQVLNLMLDLQKEKNLTYVFITHDLSVVKHISNNICVMYLGQVVEKAPSKELFKKTLHPYTKALISAIPVPNTHYHKNRILLEGEITSPINPAPGCRFAARCKYAAQECKNPQILREAAKDHFVLCCKYEEINDNQRV